MSKMENFQFDMPKNQSNVIKVIGVGGGGSNAINHMFSQGINGVDFVICNTDSQALESSSVPNKIQLGVTLTEGLGAGANPEIGEQSAVESMEDIKSMLTTNTKMLFITAGMGGGTGTGAAPIIAKMAKDLNILTVSSLLKEKSQDESILGKEIKHKMDNGDLIEDTVVISVLKEKVNSLSNEQILIDGFPRSSIQADSLLEIFDNKKLSIINFEVDDSQLLQRIKKRSMEESRADDSFFEKRLQIYKKSHQEITNSLKKNYQVTDIQANDEINAVTAKIVDKLGLN